MKIVSISIVKNEFDIIEFFARHTLSFVDECIIFDHLSTDGTREVLELLQKDNKNLFVYTYKNFEYDQFDATNTLLHFAFEERNADLVIPIDADEILVDEQDSFDPKKIRKKLEEFSTNAGTSINYFFAFRYNQEKFFVEASDSYFRMNEQRNSKKNIISKKLFFTHQNKLFLDKENNTIFVKDKKNIKKTLTTIFSNELHYNHFNIRNNNQRISKYTLGWLNILTTYGAFTDKEIYKRRYFDIIKKTGNLPIEIKPKGNFLTYPSMKDCKIEITHSKTVKKTPVISQILRYTEILASKYADLTVQSDLHNMVLFLLPYTGNAQETLKTFQSIQNNKYALKTVVCVEYTEIPDEIKKICKVVKPDEIENLHSLPYKACILCFPGDICNRIDVLMTTFIKNDCSILCCKNDIFPNRDQNIYYNPIVRYDDILKLYNGNIIYDKFLQDKRILSSGMNSFILNMNIFKNVVTKETIKNSFDNMVLYENLAKAFKNQSIYTINFPLFFREK